VAALRPERAFEAHAPEGAEFGALAELGGESCGLDVSLAQTEALLRAYSSCEITALDRGRFTSVVSRSASGVFNRRLVAGAGRVLADARRRHG